MSLTDQAYPSLSLTATGSLGPTLIIYVLSFFGATWHRPSV